jgi:hypothetical protein
MGRHGGQEAEGVGWKHTGKCAQRVSTSFCAFPKVYPYSVKVAEKVSNTLWAFPKELPIPFRYSSNGLLELLL